MQEAAKVEREQKESGTSWRSLRTAARLTPGTEPSATSCGVSTSVGLQPKRGCEQHVLVHTPGKVIWHEHKWRVSMQIFIEKIAVISRQQMLSVHLVFRPLLKEEPAKGHGWSIETDHNVAILPR